MIARVMQRLVAFADYLLTDDYLERGYVDMRLALARALFIGLPFVVVAILFCVAMP